MQLKGSSEPIRDLWSGWRFSYRDERPVTVKFERVNEIRVVLLVASIWQESPGSEARTPWFWSTLRSMHPGELKTARPDCRFDHWEWLVEIVWSQCWANQRQYWQCRVLVADQYEGTLQELTPLLDFMQEGVLDLRNHDARSLGSRVVLV